MCKAGTPITVEMTVKDDVNSGALNFFVYGLDTDKFVEGYNKLNSGALNIESFTDTEITGTLNAAEDSIIYTSIPYDKGWKVTVDGKEVSENDIVAIGDALLGASGSVVSDTASTEMSDIGNDSAEETPEASIDKSESTESDETE